ncbi:MAG: hypothetical protein PF484_08225 [Bacteroidales bacterium]|jgi:hypothetical protein|nr:hypothetical protein [Bacteroidales bacterium]
MEIYFRDSPYLEHEQEVDFEFQFYNYEVTLQKSWWSNSWTNSLVVTSSLDGYEDIDENKTYQVSIIRGNRVVTEEIKGSEIERQLDNGSITSEYYRKAMDDSGVTNFKDSGGYAFSEQQLHGIGAHEETHMADDDNINLQKEYTQIPSNDEHKKGQKIYEIEKQAMDNEMDANRDYENKP